MYKSILPKTKIKIGGSTYPPPPHLTLSLKCPPWAQPLVPDKPGFSRVHSQCVPTWIVLTIYQNCALTSFSRWTPGLPAAWRGCWEATAAAEQLALTSEHIWYKKKQHNVCLCVCTCMNHHVSCQSTLSREYLFPMITWIWPLTSLNPFVCILT